MNREIDCSATGKAGLRIESLPFAEIPGQSRLFLDYLADPIALKRFYPSAVASHTDVTKRIPEVLDRYEIDRAVLCDILAAQNIGFGCGPSTLSNIETLRKPSTVAVLTGQQAGLFTGPLYTVYKALSAIRMAACLTARGFAAVPVFWAATEDHDFDEVATATVIGTNGETVDVSYRPAGYVEQTPVGLVPIDETVSTALSELFGRLPSSEFSTEMRGLLESSYAVGENFGSSFSALISRLFAKYGIIVVDPMDARIKRLAAPIYRDAVAHAPEIVSAIRSRGDELAVAGYHSQVSVGHDYFPLFWHDDDGRRLSIKMRGGGAARIAGAKKDVSLNDLERFAETDPARFSPGVMLRPVVQDYLFPAVCYFGGGAEIAYFAQNSEAYRVLNRPCTPIFHRQSFTIVESRFAKVLKSLDISLTDIFGDPGTLRSDLIGRIVPKTARLFADVEERVNTELHRLDEALSAIDPTLAAGFSKRRRKILYHIAATRERFEIVRLQKDETVGRQMRLAAANLFPRGHLQERSLNVMQFLSRYGPYFIDWIYDGTDLDDRGHRVIYL